MKYILLLLTGFAVTLLGIDSWAGKFTPVVEPKERLVMNDTFYEQNAQLNTYLDRIQSDKKMVTPIIALGDSTLYGSLSHENETIPAELQKLLNNGQKSKQPEMKVYNLAYPGARPADLYGMLKRIRPLQPELVVVDVNVVFFSERILQEAALANQNLRAQFLFEKDVPKGMFKENRVEAIVKTAVRETNIGQNKPAINTALFQQAPRGYIRDWVTKLMPIHSAAPKTQQEPAEAPRDVIGMGWKDKPWGAKEKQTMARIYDQGDLDESNDSVNMLHRMIQYAKAHHINVVFYLAPQNEKLIGRFFSLDQLHRNQLYLKNILQEEKAWFVDVSQAVPESEFGDYDHMLQPGHARVAKALYTEMEAKGLAAREAVVK